MAGYCSPEPASTPSFRAMTLVSDRRGRSVAVNVETIGNVRVLTGGGSHGLEGWITDPRRSDCLIRVSVVTSAREAGYDALDPPYLLSKTKYIIVVL